MTRPIDPVLSGLLDVSYCVYVCVVLLPASDGYDSCCCMSKFPYQPRISVAKMTNATRFASYIGCCNNFRALYHFLSQFQLIHLCICGRPVHRAVGLLWQPSVIGATCLIYLCVHFWRRINWWWWCMSVNNIDAFPWVIFYVSVSAVWVLLLEARNKVQWRYFPMQATSSDSDNTIFASTLSTCSRLLCCRPNWE